MALLNIFKPKQLSDEELILKYKDTLDTKFVGELFQRYTHICFAVCMKYLKNQEDSKDAVMQIFEKLLTELKKHEVSFFQGWFHSLIKNYCLMLLRKRKPKAEFDENVAQKNAAVFVENDNHEHLHDKLILESKIENLEKAILLLKPDQRQCVELFYLKEKSYKEIEDLTGFDFKKVKSHIQNGKRNLKNILEQNA
ncbi:MAG: RNA polymerase sigma factor [Bacteroidia bacterium]